MIEEFLSDSFESFDSFIYLVVLLLLVLLILLFNYYYQNHTYLSIDHSIFKDMKQYYINLERSKDRNQNISKILSEQNLYPERYEAVDGKKIDLDDVQYEKMIHKIKWWFLKDNKKNVGHFGCYLSHMGIYQDFLNSENEYCLIFEDDIELLTNDLKDEIVKNMNHLPKNWNILLLGYEIDEKHKNVKRGNKDTKLKRGLLNINYFTGLHAYIINRKTARILLENLQELDWILDWNISFLAERGLLNIYGVFPPLVCQPAVHVININDINYQYNCSNKFITLTNQ